MTLIHYRFVWAQQVVAVGSQRDAQRNGASGNSDDKGNDDDSGEKTPVPLSGGGRDGGSDDGSDGFDYEQDDFEEPS